MKLYINRLRLFVLLIFFFLVISGNAYSGSVTLRWDENSETDLSGYNLYYGKSSRSYGSPVPVGKETNYTVDNLDENVRYYFALTATDYSGNESGLSNEINTLVPITEQLDTNLPTISITQPTTGVSYNSETDTINLAGIASDETSLSGIEWSSSTGQGGVALGTNNWTISDILLTAGNNIITVTARDEAGNAASDTITLIYQAADTDNVAPTIAIQSPTSRKFYFSKQALIQINGIASDNNELNRIEWVNSRGGRGVCSGTDTWQSDSILLYRRWNRITVIAYDHSGNSNQDTISVYRW